MKLLKHIADRIGVDPWDIDRTYVRYYVSAHEEAPVSRFVWGSPCRFVRSIDMMVHVVLPEMLAERHPVWACYLRTTSPRWGRAWRDWSDMASVMSVL